MEDQGTPPQIQILSVTPPVWPDYARVALVPDQVRLVFVHVPLPDRPHEVAMLSQTILNPRYAVTTAEMLLAAARILDANAQLDPARVDEWEQQLRQTLAPTGSTAGPAAN